MSVTHVIPGGLSEGRRVKSRALPSPLKLVLPSDRPAGLSARRPAAVGRSAPRTAPARQAINPLVMQAASTGCESLGILEKRAREVAIEFRFHRTTARAGLLDLINGALAVVTLAVSVADATGEDFDTLFERDGINAADATRRAVNQIVASQTASDQSAVAETIERAFIPVLRAWRAVFDALVGPGDFDPLGHVA